ncbi:hypothetical protein GCM10012279_29290 [Micromonospora yangpuensis]|nr:hypothetical protein GCM10012279_29290 [Micromonospora yangpuensis]
MLPSKPGSRRSGSTYLSCPTAGMLTTPRTLYGEAPDPKDHERLRPLQGHIPSKIFDAPKPPKRKKGK